MSKLSDLLVALCDVAGVDHTHCTEINAKPHEITFHIFNVVEGEGVTTLVHVPTMSSVPVDESLVSANAGNTSEEISKGNDDGTA